MDVETFEMSASLTIPNNTILRGAGIGNSILAVSKLSSNFISMSNSKVGNVTIEVTTNITDNYVSVGASNVNVVSSAQHGRSLDWPNHFRAT